jgi:4-amino-4-deoxy-L-arabinose transferase-like glycosyltransferase
MKVFRYRGELLIAVVVWLLTLIGLGWLGVFDVDEAIFSEATREMVVSGDYVTPHYNLGKPPVPPNGKLTDERYDKPPLIYWLMALPMTFLGPTAFAARLVCATAGALLVFLVGMAGKEMFGFKSGLWAAVAMGTCLHYQLLTRYADTDVVLTLFMTAGWLALWRATERGSRGWLLLAAVALALAVLTKGPLAALLPTSATVIVYLLMRRRLRVTWSATHPIQAAIVHLAFVLPWCVAIYRAHGAAFFRMFLGYHNLDRALHTQSGHGGGYEYFFLVLLVGLAPWTGAVLAGIVRGMPFVARALRPESEGGCPEGRAVLYCILWMAFVLLPYTLAKTKLFNYIAPCYPAAALLAGFAMNRVPHGRPERIFLNLAVLVAAGAALVAAPFWLPNLAFWSRDLGITKPNLSWRPEAAGAGILVLAGVAWLLSARKHRLGPTSLAVAGAGSGLILWLLVAPVVYHYQQGTLRVMTLAIQSVRQPDDIVATLNVHVPSLAFTLRDSFQRFTVAPTRPPAPAPATPPVQAKVPGQPEPPAAPAPPPTPAAPDPAAIAARAALMDAMSGPKRVFLITQDTKVGDVLDDMPHTVWAKWYGWTLYGNQPPPDDFHLPRIPWTQSDVAEASRELSR